MCTFLLEHGANIDHRSDAGITAIYNATILGNEAVVKGLLNYGAAVEPDDLTYLLENAGKRARRSEQSIQKIVEYFQDNQRDTGLPSILEAAICGNSEAVMAGHSSITDLEAEQKKQLLQFVVAFCTPDAYNVCVSVESSGSDVVQQREDCKNAAWNGNLDMLKQLLQDPPDEPFLEDLLYNSVRGGSLSCLEFLQRYEMTVTSEFTEKLYGAACQNDDVPVMELLQSMEIVPRDIEMIPAYEEALYFESDAAANYLLDHYLNDGNAWRILADSAGAGKADVVEKCLSFDVEQRHLGQALIEASSTGSLDCIKLLLEAGADVNTNSIGPGSPLIVASLRGHLDAVDLLLQNHADPNMECWDSKTTVMNLMTTGSARILQRLITAGGDINHTDSTGKTPLMDAAKNDNITNAKILLDAGADPNLKDEEGKTAKDIAKEVDARDILDRLAA